MRIYKINIFYIKFLQSLDSRVMWPKEYRFSRPYVGVLFDINSHKFFGPLSSNKQNKVNWSIIKLDSVSGSIFLANMIPIPNKYLLDIVSNTDIDKYFFSEDYEDENYGLKLFGQSEILKQDFIHKELIKKSKRLYKLQPYNIFYNKLCCDFRYLVKESLNWNISFWYLIYLIKQYSLKFNIACNITKFLNNQ